MSIFLYIFRRCFPIAKQDALINEEIRHPQVRVIDADGSQLGILPTKEALKKAGEGDLDLVLIAPNAEPPVCRIMDYGKYRFEQIKKEKEGRKNQKVVDLKEVKLGVNIGIHDFETKVNQAVKFLNAGDKCKVTIRFRGREMAHTRLGNELMERFSLACGEVGVIENPAKLDGRNMIMIMSGKAK